MELSNVEERILDTEINVVPIVSFPFFNGILWLHQYTLCSQMLTLKFDLINRWISVIKIDVFFLIESKSFIYTGNFIG
jgi:hypothetical protein